MNAIVTRSDDNIKEMSELTHPSIKRYADRCHADFIILDKPSECPASRGYHYKIFEIYDLFDFYDRILHLDSDVLVQNNCPNLFDVIPDTHIGTVFEDKGSREADRRLRMDSVSKKWGDVNWKGYINTGVFMVSRCHEDIFSTWNGEFWTDAGWDDVHLGWQISRLGYPVYELDYKFNHMSMFSELWNGSPSRFNSYIIHYAGVAGFPDKANRSRLQLIKDDLSCIFSENKV